MSYLDERIEIGDTRSLAEAINEEFPKALGDPLLNWAFSAYTEFDKGVRLRNSLHTTMMKTNCSRVKMSFYRMDMIKF